MDFKKYLQEAADKTAVMAFGRFNPPTVGHEKLIQKVKSEADKRNASGHIVTSHSEKTDDNPLPQKVKIGYLKRIAYGNNIVGSSTAKPTFLHAAADLYAQGHRHLVMIAGSDRVQEYKDKLEKYNDGKEYPHGKYKFKSIKVVSAGARDPDSEGVEGISGSKMRAFSRANQTSRFREGLPLALQDHAEEMIGHINKATGVTPASLKKQSAAKHNPWLKEDYDNPHRFDWGTPEGSSYMQKMTPNKKIECVNPGEVWSEKLGMCVSLREAYINYDIFKLNDLVEAKNGDRGTIVYRGSTYVTLQLESGKTSKYWISDIKETIASESVIPRIISRQKINEKKIPALFMSKEQLEEMAGPELSYQGYTTEYLHMCPGASKQLHELVQRTDLNPKFILQAIQATDAYLGIEKIAVKQGFSSEQLTHDFLMKLAIAHDTLNMLGYPDKDLMYMEKHVATMSKLNMHRDATFSNEVIATVPTFGAGDVEEGTTMEKDLLSIRKKLSELYEPDPPTATRDINRTGDKEVFHGVDAVHPESGHPGKPVGLVSFKTYMATPETAKIEKDKSDAMIDVHRKKAELQAHSTAYKQMKKASIQDV